MFTTIFPGLRAARAPLVSGYLLLVSAYLFFHSAIAQDRSDAMDALIRRIGRPGELAASALAAYLVGSLNTDGVKEVMTRLTFRANRRAVLRARRLGELDAIADPDAPIRWRVEPPAVRSIDWVFSCFFPHAYRRLARTVAEAIASAGPESDSLAIGAVPSLPDSDTQLLLLVTQEALFADRDLLSSNKNLYDEVDRLMSETELRDALLLPLPLAFVAVEMNVSQPWWVRVIGSIILAGLMTVIFIQARRMSLSARSTLARQVAGGGIKTDTLERLQVLAEQRRRRSQSNSTSTESAGPTATGTGSGDGSTDGAG